MKKIEAYIKSHKLLDVTMALQKVDGLRGMSVLFARGFGRREVAENQYRKVDDLMDFSEHMKIEIFCNDDLVEELVGVIDKNATTGLRGDGKIYVSDVVSALKIGKGEIG
ncbi:MAG: P-II family nitrogen regulator [Nitrospirae bacterium]|nr:P-II family nitrogen regulator [Nitrospirota bacterium]MCL5421669.1 P-II family nitrogen regulator [Nitrospirota bacterium]